MARKETIIKIQDRDQELTFKIREMSATQLESWLIRALLLVAGSGAQVPDGSDIKAAGGYLAEKGLAALGAVDFEKAKPLLDEMLGCCSRLVEKVEERCTPESLDAYVQDVGTLFRLRKEAVRLNLGFLGPEGERLSGFLGKPATATL
jgi:hypothetical protein